MEELYKKYRPALLKEVLGQPDACKVLLGFIKNDKIPHAVLLTGPSGCGKTTIARILSAKLKCGETGFSEINCADFRGIEMVRDIRTRMNYKRAGGGGRVWLIDECHKLSADAQEAFLKILEDTPKHVWFFLATTTPGKLIKTITNRCTEVRLQALSDPCMEELLDSVAKKEKFTLSEEVRQRIIEVSEGSPRKGLVLLNQILAIEEEEEQLNAILSSDAKKQATDLYMGMVRGAKWPEMAKLISSIDEEPETIRRIILACCTTSMLKPGSKFAAKAYFIATIFRDHWYDCGKAGLAICCYEIVHIKV